MPCCTALPASLRLGGAVNPCPEDPKQEGSNGCSTAIDDPVLHRSMAVGEERLEQLINGAQEHDGQRCLDGARKRCTNASAKEQECQ
jgi:hypothetical protein